MNEKFEEPEWCGTREGRNQAQELHNLQARYTKKVKEQTTKLKEAIINQTKIVNLDPATVHGCTNSMKMLASVTGLIHLTYQAYNETADTNTPMNRF